MSHSEMSKRKAPDSCSDTSVVDNPQKFLDFTVESSSGSFVKKPKFDLDLHLHLGGSIEFRVFNNVKLNGAPFYDFFASKAVKFPENKTTTQVCLDLALVSVSPPHCLANPVLRSRSLLSVAATDTSTIISSGNNTCLADCETETETETEIETEGGLDVVPLNVHIPDDATLLNVGIPATATVEVAAVEWRVKKVLTKSDCDNQCRLLISRQVAEEHILNHFDESRRKKIESGDGLRLNVLDCDTTSLVEQKLKRWPSNNYLALMSKWKKDFVVRRGLKKGDEVGLCWDNQHHRLLFTVLRRSAFIDN